MVHFLKLDIIDYFSIISSIWSLELFTHEFNCVLHLVECLIRLKRFGNVGVVTRIDDACLIFREPLRLNSIARTMLQPLIANIVGY